MIRREVVYEGVEREELWAALTEAERLEDWFASDVELDLRPGGGASFRWGNGEERRATVVDVDPERRLALRFEDEGEVEFTLADAAGGTRLVVVETSPSWTTALDLQASALARV